LINRAEKTVPAEDSQSTPALGPKRGKKKKKNEGGGGGMSRQKETCCPVMRKKTAGKGRGSAMWKKPQARDVYQTLKMRVGQRGSILPEPAIKENT